MVGLLSDVGNIRNLNEDYLGYEENQEVRLYVIADGMGGHNAGEVASKIAVETTISYIKEIISTESKYDIEQILCKAVLFSNEKIYSLSKGSDCFNGMGTTITACLLKDNVMAVANVGDSSCFVIKENNVHKITKDHSLVQQLVDNGSITVEEAKEHPNKNIITRALGTNPNVEVDIYSLEIDNVSHVILATDGLTNDVSPQEICHTVLNNDLNDACEKLVALSKSRAGRDNISVIVFKGECKDDRYFTGE